MTTDYGQDSMTGSGGAEHLQQAAADVADQAARTTEAQASRTMMQAGQTLDQVARAIRDAGNGMRDDQPQVAGVADMAADRIEQASQYLTQHDAQEFLGAAQDFARRQPMAIVGGGLLLGLAVGRLLRSGSGAPGGDARWASSDGSRFAGSYDTSGYGAGSGTRYDTSAGSSAYAGTTGTGYAGAGAVGAAAAGADTTSGYGSSTGWDEPANRGMDDIQQTESGIDVAAMSSDTAAELRETDDAAGREA